MSLVILSRINQNNFFWSPHAACIAQTCFTKMLLENAAHSTRSHKNKILKRFVNATCIDD